LGARKSLIILKVESVVEDGSLKDDQDPSYYKCLGNIANSGELLDPFDGFEGIWRIKF
jgi:hypothetical protein